MRQIIVALIFSALPMLVIALDDPTKPAFHPAANAPLVVNEEVGSEEATRELALSSILISSNRRVAVINGQIVKRDELIEGGRVVSIEPGRVVLDDAGEKIELFLLPDMKTKSRQHD